jgi:hypothetical protein
LFDELDIVVTSIEVLVDDVVVNSRRSWLGVEEGHRFQQKLGSRGGVAWMTMVWFFPPLLRLSDQSREMWERD